MRPIVGRVQLAAEVNVPSLRVAGRRNDERHLRQYLEIERGGELRHREVAAAGLLNQSARDANRIGGDPAVSDPVENLRRSNVRVRRQLGRGSPAAEREQQKLQRPVNGKDAAAVLDRRERVDGSAIEQQPPQSAGTVVGGEPRWKDQPGSPTWTQQPHDALDEELIEIAVPRTLQRILARSADESVKRARVRVAAVIPQHLPGRIAEDHVEASAGPRRAGQVVKNLWKLEGPMEETALRGDGAGPGQKRVGGMVWQRARAAHEAVEERLEHRSSGRLTALQVPRRTPDIGGRFPSVERSARPVQRRQHPLLFADLLDRVIGSVDNRMA